MHCKAGRGRSTTLVICYLIRQMRMSPEDAYEFVRTKRPQVCLAEGQWAAVREVRLYSLSDRDAHCVLMQAAVLPALPMHCSCIVISSCCQVRPLSEGGTVLGLLWSMQGHQMCSECSSSRQQTASARSVVHDGGSILLVAK